MSREPPSPPRLLYALRCPVGCCLFILPFLLWGLKAAF